MASIQKITVKGTDYWRLVESKRVNGKPTISILESYGNTRKFMKTMAERAAGTDKAIAGASIISYAHGDTYALLKMAEKYDILRLLDATLPKREREGVKRSFSLLLIALQMACCPDSRNSFRDWFESTSMPIGMNLSVSTFTSNHFWEQMSDITEEQLTNAEDAIINKIFTSHNFKIGKICLDYTNYYTFIDTGNEKCTIAARGHNKQKRYDLRQYSLALITSKDLGLALFSHLYEGNVNDQTVFSVYIDILARRIPEFNPGGTTLIFDGGSVNKANLFSLATHYICSFSMSSCKDMYKVPMSEYADYEINGQLVKAYRTSRVIWGKMRTCVLTYSIGLFEGQSNDMAKKLLKLSSSLEQLNSQLSNPKSRIGKTREQVEARVQKLLKSPHLKKIIELDYEVEGESVKKLSYCVAEPAKEAAEIENFGKKLTITDRDDLTTEEIITDVRDQDCIEKLFRYSKDKKHFAFRPQHHYTNQKIRVQAFCCILGLNLTVLLQKELALHNIIISLDDLLDTLSGIKLVAVRLQGSSNTIKKLEDMSDGQAAIWEIIEKL
jgi:transposase